VVVRELELDLDAFEGPFDLLLTLVLKQELEPAEVDVAGIVLAFLERLAERDELDLEGVVPVAPAGLDMARWLRIIEAHPLIQGILRSPVRVPESVLRATVAEVYKRIAFHRPGSVDGKAIRAFTSHFADPRDVARYLSTGRSLMPELSDPFRLERITCPVLVVWGEQDRMVMSKGAQRVIDAVPGARLELLDGCGHCPQVECPDRFTDLLLEFPQLPLADAA